MATSLPNFLLVLLCSSLVLPSSATKTHQTPVPTRPNKLVLKVQKDGATNLHTAQIYKRTPPVQFSFLLDLNGKFLSINCENKYLSATYNAPVCHSSQCARAMSHTCRTCGSPTGSRPGCHTNSCGIMTMNPVTRQSAMGEVAQDALTISTTQGSNPGPMVRLPQFLFACAPSNILQKGLPKNVRGIAGLGHSPISLPYQLASHFGFPPKFAVCLASSPAQNGVVFFGEGPILMNQGIDVSRKLTYVPLTVSQQGEYHIDVQSIKINNKMVPINATLLRPKQGFPGAMISTTTPYTVLQTSIFRTLIQLFISKLHGVQQVKAVAPFGACFDANSIPRSTIGPIVASINLVLDSKQNITWRIFGSNSMVQPRPGVMCLGFVDGGMRPQAPIVLGAKQLEDNLLQFDLMNSKLGFSSSLLPKRTKCGNFNFGNTTNYDSP